MAKENWWDWVAQKFTPPKSSKGWAETAASFSPLSWVSPSYKNWLTKAYTPPKSKSPWEAATAGSTGGWAGSFAPGQKYGFVGPLLTTAAGAIPGVGPFISAGMGAAGMAGAGGFKGTDYGWGNLGSTIGGAALGYGEGLLGQSIGSGLYSAAGGMPVGASSTWAPGQIGANAGTWGKGALGAFGSGFGVTGIGKMGTSALNKFGGTATKTGAGTMPVGAASTYAPGQIGANAGTYGAGATTWNPAQFATGAAISALPYFTGTPKGTEIPPSPMYGEYTQRLLKGTELGQYGREGMKDLESRWAEPQFTPLSDEMYSASVRKNKEMEEQAIKSLDAEWQGIQPGANIANNRNYAATKRDIQQRFGDERMAIQTELDFNREKEYMGRLDQYFTNKMNYFTTIMGLSQNEINQFGQLAQLDIAQIQSQAMLSAGEAVQFKQLFGDIGGYLLRGATGMTYQDMVKLMQPTTVGVK